MADGTQPPAMSPDDISATVGPTADSRYDKEITYDCEDCTSWVRVSARYPDEWGTPMAGALFEVRQDDSLIYRGRLHSKQSLGIAPEAEMTPEQREEIGSFTVPNVPPGPIVFEILPEASEGDVLAIEDEIRQMIAQMLTETQAGYAAEWQEWNEKSALGQGGELISAAFAGFTGGVGTWWEEERGFWASIGDFFSAAWDAIVETLGDVATALHPSNLRQTAEAVWDGAVGAADSLVEMVAGIPEAAQEFYAGTMLIINNIGAITDFIGDFVKGDTDGVERFVTTILPQLVEDSAELAEWQAMIRNNADAWQSGLEVMMGTQGPALLVAAVAGLCSAIPPQVWAESGIASVTIIAIELTISAIIGFLAGVATVFTGGAALAAAGALLVGRAAKWARMGGRVMEQMQAIMGKIDKIIEKIVKLGSVAVRARRWGTRDNGTRPGATGSETEQEREESPDLCRNCGSRLGGPGHGEREPNFADGDTSKNTDYRGVILRATANDSSSLGSVQSLHEHIAAHHLISWKALDNTGDRQKYERLGYNLNTKDNLSLIPSNGRVACHLWCQLHRGDHKWGTYNYHNEVQDMLRDLDTLKRYCQSGRTNDIQRDMDRISRRIAQLINVFDLPLTQAADDFRPDRRDRGCCNVEGVTHGRMGCSTGRNHSLTFDFASLSVPYQIEAAK